MVSFDSLLSNNPETSPASKAGSHVTESQANHTSSQVIKPSRNRAPSSVGVYPEADADKGSFMRHYKYFFEDGNITFLVRDIQS
jgi:hypothetical protein